jgi:hypothetical protein
VAIIIDTNFFQNKFGVSLTPLEGQLFNRTAEDPRLHTIVYLQVAVISQALIFVTRSHGFFFMERPSYALLGAFCVAQLVSSIIAAYANWGFTKIHSVSGGWIGIVWVWVSTCLIIPGRLKFNIGCIEHYLVLPTRPDQVRHEGDRHQIYSQPPTTSTRTSCRASDRCPHYPYPVPRRLYSRSHVLQPCVVH